MPKILGMEPRVALLVGGAVAVVAFLAWRARSAAGAAASAADVAPALPDALPGAGAAAGAAGQQGQDQFALAMQNLELASAQQEQQFRAGQLKRQGELEEAQAGVEKSQAGLLQQAYSWAQGKGKLPGAIQCPKGKVRFDPGTMQFYCREKQHKSIGQALGSLGTAAGRNAKQAAELYAASQTGGAYIASAPTPKRGFGAKKKVR